MPGPLRVCHVIHSLGPGGAEAVLVDLAEAAGDAGMVVDVVSLASTAAAANAARLRGLGVRVHDAGGRFEVLSVPRGVAAVTGVRPDVVHTHLKHADLVGALAAGRLGAPLVSTLHLIEDAVSPAGASKRWLAAQVRIRRAAATIAVSDAVRAWYLGAFAAADPARTHTVRNGVLPPATAPATRAAMRAKLGLPDDVLAAVMVAVMRPGKGHRDLLAAVPHVDPAVRFVLVGDGPLRAELEAAAAALPPGRVVFTGFREDVPDVLAAADLVVHPSHFDALPTALISALAAARPVVATDVGGIPEVVAPDVGVLVPPRDPAALAGAVNTLARDPQLRDRLGAAGRRRFDAEFDARVWAHRLRALYDQVLA